MHLRTARGLYHVLHVCYYSYILSLVRACHQLEHHVELSIPLARAIHSIGDQACNHARLQQRYMSAAMIVCLRKLLSAATAKKHQSGRMLEKALECCHAEKKNIKVITDEDVGG